MSDEQVIRSLSDGDPAGLSPAELAELDELAAFLDDPTLWVEPDVALADRVVEAVERERSATASTGFVADVGDVEASQIGAPCERQADAAEVVPISSARPRTGSARRWVQPFLAGMAVAAAGMVGLIALRNTSGGADATLLQLAGTELAPVGVSGTARITETESGLRIELDATGLPRRDGREFYQAWLKGEAGLVPIGTFHTGDDVVLWAGVALADFPTLTVTLEEVGDQESSGQRVLIGKLGG